MSNERLHDAVAVIMEAAGEMKGKADVGAQNYGQV